MSRKNLIPVLALFLAGFLIVPGTAFGQSTPPPGPHVPGELLVIPNDGVTDAELASVLKKHRGKVLKKLGRAKAHRIKVRAKSLDAVESALAKDPRIKVVERNFLAESTLVPNDPGFPTQWHLSKIAAASGWDLTTGSTGVIIAVIDAGVDSTHPDLNNKLLPGFNFVSNTTDTSDATGHGTAVAGTAAAETNSGIGVAGLGWNNSIMPLAVINPSTGTASYADIAEAIIYAADHGAKVINMSLAGSSYSTTLQNAVNYAWSKGLVLVAAAGNKTTSTPYYPAALDNVVAVSATDKYDQLASFSNFGSWIDVAAPGTSIYTTNRGGGYGTWQGTSFASPQVAALAALVFSLNPGLSNAQVVDLIRSNTTDLGSVGFDQSFGWGRINAYKTLTAAAVLPALNVEVLSPSDGNTVSGTVPVTVDAASDLGILKVELYVDGQLKDTETTAPYNLTWNTSGSSGVHTLVARAYDVAGNSTNSAPVDVNVVAQDVTPPTVAITGVSLSSKFMTVTASASDPEGSIAKVELYVDGALKATDYSSAYSFKINVNPWPKGSSHRVQAKAYDAAGNTGTSTEITVVK
ncbi:MAG TPA: S8 family serine peptidase [Candidatus Acidoferrales bacterium]|nr:S8 family serine peptidase [Candidatus Acidoferrales bacterium]